MQPDRIPNPLILDGGLATELESMGHDLRHRLWSARLLLENPEAIRQAHLTYLRAGAGCIISASYQATIQGFVALGMSEQQALVLLDLAITLGREALDQYCAEASPPRRPLLAASVGPYGAFLADGSEYRGNYQLDQPGLYQFHQQRLLRLAASEADLLACETIPCIDEAVVLARLIGEVAKPGWISFSCRDGAHLSSGEPIEQAAQALADSPSVFALGVNCTAPQHVGSLVARLRKYWNGRVVVYPNSGERYCADTGDWQGTSSPIECAAAASSWRANGADIIGGCCRMGPDHISAIARSLS